MLQLNERQKLILALVIHDYTETAQPVGSQRLVDRYSLGLSPATVRNAMVDLTDAGYLRQPHTSAGRVPTEEGYRYFVRQLMGQTELPANTRNTIVHQFYQAGPDVNRWMRLAASVLAHQSQGASLVTAPRPEQARFKHLSLISTHGRQVLMVTVFGGGEVRQQMLVLAEPVPQDRLSETANYLNQNFAGLDFEQIRHRLSAEIEQLRDDIKPLMTLALEAGNEALSGSAAPYVISGEHNLPVTRTAARELRHRFDGQMAALTLGDGGAAVILDASPDPAAGFHHLDLVTGARHDHYCYSRPSRRGAGGILVTKPRGLQRKGNEHFPAYLKEILDRSGWTLDDLDHIIPHQVSVKAIENGVKAVARYLGTPLPPCTRVSADVYANTSTTSHFLALHRFILDGTVNPGDNLLLVSGASGIVISHATYTFDDLPARYRSRWASGAPAGET